MVKRAANQRKDSIEQFEAGGRPELAVPEKEELAVIESLLPAQMSREQVGGGREGEDRRARRGGQVRVPEKLTGAVMGQLKGQADGGLVKEVVDSLLI